MKIEQKDWMWVGDGFNYRYLHQLVSSLRIKKLQSTVTFRAVLYNTEAFVIQICCQTARINYKSKNHVAPRKHTLIWVFIYLNLCFPHGLNGSQTSQDHNSHNKRLFNNYFPQFHMMIWSDSRPALRKNHLGLFTLRPGPQHKLNIH